MNVSDLSPAVSNKAQFTYEFHKFVPPAAGCYVLATFDGHILYVGLTDNLHRRFAEHRETKAKCALTSQGAAVWFYYLLMSKAEIHRTERTWLNSHADAHGVLPILNKINSPIA